MDSNSHQSNHNSSIKLSKTTLRSIIQAAPARLKRHNLHPLQKYQYRKSNCGSSSNFWGFLSRLSINSYCRSIRAAVMDLSLNKHHQGLSQLNMASNWQKKRCTRDFSCSKIWWPTQRRSTRIRILTTTANHMHRSTALSVCKWQVLCLKRNWDTTCSGASTRNLKVARVGTLSLNTPATAPTSHSKA